MASHCCANDTFITFYRFFTLNANLRPFIVAATTILFVSNAQATTIRSLLSFTSYSCLPTTLPPPFLSLVLLLFLQALKLIYENVCAEDAAGFAQAQARAWAQLGSIMLPTNRHMSRCTNTNTHLLAFSRSLCLFVCVLLLFVCWVCLGHTTRIRNVAHTQQGEPSAALEYCNKSQMPDMNNF